MKKIYNAMLVVFTMSLLLSCNVNNKDEAKLLKKKKRTLAEKAEDTQERWLHEFNMQKNPTTGLIPKKEKNKELEYALVEKQSNFSAKSAAYNFVSRGPSNLGGRTRALKIDISDATGNTMIAGGVSSGVFRTTNGGASWTKVSGLNDIHNVTAIAQDPRPGFQNIWYYGTGEIRGNSAGLQENYLGNGVWKSTDSGLTWQQIPETANGQFQVFDNFFDFIVDLEVHPVTGELFIGTHGKVYRLENSGPVVEIEIPSNNTGWTDITITTEGRVYATLDGNATNGGVYTSLTGRRSWTNINPTSSDFDPQGRITLALAASNENIVYALYDNGENNRAGNRVPEADLWQYNFATNTWTDYSSILPDEPGADSDGNDPFSIQGAYDLVVSVKPDNENFVVIGGTNVYKTSDITASNAVFKRIGGYSGAGTYGLYSEGGVNHHPDIHALTWSITDTNVFFTGTDGGVHKTENINSNFVSWQNLNNNYLTYQYYHVNMVNEAGDDFIIGGAQDNGTTIGGLNAGNPDASTMNDYFGGDGAAVAVSLNSGVPGTDYTTYVTTQRGSMYRGNQNQVTANIQPIESLDGGGSPVYYPSQFVTYFHMDPENPQTLYYASNGSLLRTNDAENVAGDTWTLLGNLTFSERITTFETTRGAYSPESSYLFIGGRGGNIFRLKDPINVEDLSTLQKITPAAVPINPVETNNGQYTSDIAVHPTNPDIVMITYASYGDDVKNIFVTNNATATTPTWTEVERNLESFSIRAGAIASVNGETTYFVGTARGLYSSDDPTTEDWTLQGGNTMGIPVVSGLVYRPSDNILLMGTHGNGIYQADLNSPLSVDNINADKVKLALYPNPTQFKLRFATTEIELNNDTKYSIYDIKGAAVLNGRLVDKSIDVSTLNKGLYIVSLRQNNKVVTKKFIKN